MKKINLNLPEESEYLRLVGTSIVFSTQAGFGIDDEHKGPFDWIDGSFNERDSQTTSMDTTQVTTFIYQQKKKGDYQKIFASLGTDIKLMSFLTHKQIASFVRSSENLLHPGDRATHFPFVNINGDILVARVYRVLGDIKIHLENFDSPHVWESEDSPRFVICQN